MGTTNDNPTIDGKKGTPHQDATDTRNFIQTHDVTKVARKPIPGAGEESADLLQNDIGPAKRQAESGD